MLTTTLIHGERRRRRLAPHRVSALTEQRLELVTSGTVDAIILTSSSRYSVTREECLRSNHAYLVSSPRCEELRRSIATGDGRRYRVLYLESKAHRWKIAEQKSQIYVYVGAVVAALAFVALVHLIRTHLRYKMNTAAHSIQ